MAETIFAQATPPGRSGVAVFRVSGPAAFASATALGATNAPPRYAALRRLTHPQDGRVLDDALVLRFVAPTSFTGEDTVEFHLHGGPAVCRCVADALTGIPGLRHAEPGEFTRRALMNGKLDLAQAEGLADLLAAETAAQVSQALALIDGRLSEQVLGWRERLIRALAVLEASIDFSEEDLPPAALREVRGVLGDLVDSFERALAGGALAERLRVGFDVALVGAPNVGKSTLLNALAGRDAAITSEFAGTTRDLIEVRMDLDGLPVTIVDMAGLHETADPVERIGVEKGVLRAGAADLRIFLTEGTVDPLDMVVPWRPGDQIVISKADLRGAGDLPSVSGLTGAGIPELLARVKSELQGRAADAGLAGHERQRKAIRSARLATLAAAERLEASAPELAVEDVRAAIRALDHLIGKVDVEAVLDEVFARFCIGK